MDSKKIGRYILVDKLGRGGMAVVYRGQDPDFDRDVAIKLLPQDFLDNSEFRLRFLREARAVARLEHPAIVPVYDIGEQDGQPFLVMRYMTGGTLGAKLAKGRLSTVDSFAVVKRIASALDEAHTRGMVHRDIKPGNILFDSQGNAYLSDFGIVKWAQASTTLTGGGLIGTPAYMSPEQAEGRSELGPAADIYALGVVLFQMLSGQLPFEADTPVGLALLHMREPVPSVTSIVPSVPVVLQGVIERAMAKHPRDRYASARELASAVEAAISKPQKIPVEASATYVTAEIEDPSQSVGPKFLVSIPKTLRTPNRSLRPKWIVLALGGVGVAALVVFGLFGSHALLPTVTQTTPSSTVTIGTVMEPLPSSTPKPTETATVLPPDQEQSDIDLRDNTTVGGTPHQKLAQVFTVSRSGYISQVALPLGCQPSARVSIQIEVEIDGEPSGEILALEVVPGNELMSYISSTVVDFSIVTFSDPPPVSAGESYAFTIDTEGGDCVIFYGPPGDTYAGGRAYFKASGNPPGWMELANPIRDLAFQIYVSANQDRK